MDQLRVNRHYAVAPGHIPIDLISIMLRTMPVPQLTEMRLVSQEWNALIMSDRFGRIHRAQMTIDNQWVYYFVNEAHYRPLRFDGRYIYYRSDRLNGGTENQIDILCSCSGLAACVTITDDIYFWNAMTTARSTIPQQPIVCPQFHLSGRVSFSLGRAEEIDDFVLVRITIFGGPVSRNEVMVFSRNNNTWSRAPDFPYETPFLRSGVYVSGHLHWIINMGERRSAIATLCLSTLTYNLMMLDPNVIGQPAYVHLDRLGTETLCVYSSLTPIGGFYHLCMLLDYDDQATWTRIEIQLDDTICEIEYHVNLQPLHFLDGERTQILFRVNPVGTFGMYNMVTGTYERMVAGYIGIQGHVNVVRFLHTLERPSRPFA